jgi:hypothetical protein
MISCDKEAESLPDLPPAKPFVTCYLTNTEQDIMLYYKTPVSVNVPGYKGNVKDATITISNGSQSGTMEYDTLYNVYKLDTSEVPLRKGSRF